MAKATIPDTGKQRTAQINTLVGYVEALIHDHVTLQVEEVFAISSKREVNPKMKQELMDRIGEARASLRTTLDLLLP